MTPQAISIVTMAANLSNALFAINAAESSNSFGRKVSAICQNSCPQMFKQAGLSVVVVFPFPSVCWFQTKMTARFTFRIFCDLIKQLIPNSIPEFVNLVPETSNWWIAPIESTMTEKTAFQTDGSAWRKSEPWSIAACRKKKEFSSEILDTRVSILDELASRQQTLFSLQNNMQEKKKKVACHFLRMGLQVSLNLSHDPAQNQSSPAMFGLTKALCGKMNSSTTLAQQGCQCRVKKVEPGQTIIICHYPACALMCESTLLADDFGTNISAVVFLFISQSSSWRIKWLPTWLFSRVVQSSLYYIAVFWYQPLDSRIYFSNGSPRSHFIFSTVASFASKKNVHSIFILNVSLQY